MALYETLAIDDIRQAATAKSETASKGEQP